MPGPGEREHGAGAHGKGEGGPAHGKPGHEHHVSTRLKKISEREAYLSCVPSSSSKSDAFCVATLLARPAPEAMATARKEGERGSAVPTRAPLGDPDTISPRMMFENANESCWNMLLFLFSHG